MKKTGVIAGLLVFLGGFIAMAPPEASAVPAFARTYQTECTLCHVAFPKLNEFGIKFRANGYRLEGEDGKYLWDQPVSLGFVGEFAYTSVDQDVAAGAEEAGHTEYAGGDEAMPDMPGMRAAAQEDGHAAGESSSAAKEKRRSAKFDFENLLIYSAGTLAPRASYFAHLMATGEATMLSLANVSFLDILPKAALNIKAGKMAVDLPYLSSSRKLTKTDYLTQITQAAGHGHGGAAATTGATLVNEGVELNGIFGLGDAAELEYALGVGNDSVESSDNNVGAYNGYVTLNWSGQSLGFIYKHDRLGETEDTRENADGYGVAADLNFADLYLTAAYFWFKRTATGSSDVKINSGLLEAGYPVLPELYLVGRYDFNDTQDSDEKISQIVGSLIWYARPNLKLQAEYASRVDTDHASEDYTTNTIYGVVAFAF